jgi:hypothetical protein
MQPKEVCGFTFRANFCSGNLATVEDDGVRSDGTQAYDLAVTPDCGGTEFEVSDARTWFHFGVKRAASATASRAQFSVLNFNDHSKMYSQGMRVVTRTVRGGAVPCPPHEFSDGTPWRRTPLPTNCEKDPDTKSLATLTWEFNFDGLSADTEVFFAFCFPHSFAQCQSWLSSIESAFPFAGSETPSTTSSSSSAGAATATASSATYVCRETLATSIEGRPIEMLTISSHDGMGAACDAGIGEGKARRFPGKPIVFVSARVHPGETPASFILMGLVDLALAQRAAGGAGDAAGAARLADALCAARFRQHFVLKVVPMLNPDGVAKGHYRNNVRGENLNRVYAAPDAALHPAVHAVRHAMETWTARGENVALYVDLHAHSKKRGCFVYGNHLASVAEQIENVLYAKLVSLCTPHFDFGGSQFSESNMDRADRKQQSKSGSGRVGLFRATGLIRCYTLEANYNCGRLANALSVATLADAAAQRAPPVDVLLTIAPPAEEKERADGEGGAAAPPAAPRLGGARRASALSAQAQKKATAAKKSRNGPSRGRGGGGKERSDDGRLKLPAVAAVQNPPYGPGEWGACGRGLLLACLELYCIAPISRLPRSNFGDIAGLRAKITAIVTRSKGYRAQRKPRAKVVVKTRAQIVSSRRQTASRSLIDITLDGGFQRNGDGAQALHAPEAAAQRKLHATRSAEMQPAAARLARTPAGSGAVAVLRQRVLAEALVEQQRSEQGGAWLHGRARGGGEA